MTAQQHREFAGQLLQIEGGVPATFRTGILEIATRSLIVALNIEYGIAGLPKTAVLRVIEPGTVGDTADTQTRILPGPVVDGGAPAAACSAPGAPTRRVGADADL